MPAQVRASAVKQGQGIVHMSIMPCCSARSFLYDRSRLLRDRLRFSSYSYTGVPETDTVALRDYPISSTYTRTKACISGRLRLKKSGTPTDLPPLLRNK